MYFAHYSLDNLLKRLVRSADSKQAPELYAALVEKVNRKVDYYTDKGEVWAHKFRLEPVEDLNQGVIDAVVQRNIPGIFGPEHLVMYQNAQTKEIVWDQTTNMFIPTLRRENRIIFDNPRTGVIESWYHPVLAPTTKHEAYSLHPTASVLLKNMNRFDTELEVFNQGLGILTHPARLFMYHRFNMPIGLEANNETFLFKLQVDRRKIFHRHSVEVHGYPISEQELRRTPRELYERLLD